MLLIFCFLLIDYADNSSVFGFAVYPSTPFDTDDYLGI